MVLWWSTVYLRFHYFVDLLAGVVVALVGLWMARKYADGRLEQPATLADSFASGVG
jgi:membrane-associated phospholipid phosphatase